MHKVRSISELKKDGFALNEWSPLADLALLSLRIGLRSYFKTYASMRTFIHWAIEGTEPPEGTASHTVRYIEAAAETIVHLQHFFELTFKEYLRTRHRLLADDLSKKPVLLDKILQGETVSEQEMEDAHSLEFRAAWERLDALLKAGRLVRTNLDFSQEDKDTFKTINQLRNRAWHRGRFILSYPTLDELIARYVLPIVLKLTTLEPYSGHDRFWRYPALDCGIDPLQEIINEATKGEFDVGKVAFLKELGRAAYDRPSLSPLLPDSEEVDRAHASLSAVNFMDVQRCPVCGINTLTVHETIDEYEDYSGVQTISSWTCHVKCVFCSFEVMAPLQNPRDYGFINIPDFFYDTRQQMEGDSK